MRCDDILELMVNYDDLPEGDWSRVRIDEHVKKCKSCADELSFWLESATLIQTATYSDVSNVQPNVSLSGSVMDRIYSDEKWRIPVSEKLYAIPYRLRLRLTTLIASFLALFCCSIVYSLLSPNGNDAANVPSPGVFGVNALGGNDSNDFYINMAEGLPMASIGEPFVLGLPLVEAYPDYFLAISLLGLIAALLTMNWFVRIRT
jgi:hypothetical protein